ncbi:MAG: pilin [Patescibacteria group bacterium]
MAQRKFGKKKWPSGMVGLFLGMNLIMVLLVLGASFVPTVGRAAGMCDGSYACYTSAGCAKAGGDFAACPAKCPGTGAQRGYCYVRQTSMPLTISIGGQTTVLDLGHYIEIAYRYAVYIAGIIAAVMMMVGGLQWLTAGGNSGAVSAAKKRITDALIGLVLTVFAWLILNTINPALVSLQMPRIPMVRSTEFVRCELFRYDRPCGEEFGVKENPTPPANATERQQYLVVDKNDPDILTTCIGKNCANVGDCTTGSCTCQSSGSAPAATPTAAPAETADTSTEKTQTAASDTTPASGSTAWQCRPCVTTGQDCTGLGSSNTCCGGYCGAVSDDPDQVAARAAAGTDAANTAHTVGVYDAAGSCSNGMVGLKCGTGAECHGGLCVDVADYFQAAWPIGAARNLLSGVSSFFEGEWLDALTGSQSLNTGAGAAVAAIWAGGICSNGSVGAPCNTDLDCSGDNACVAAAGAYFCTPKIIGGFCTSSAGCPSGYECGVGNNVTVTGNVSAQFSGYLSYRCSASGTVTGGRGSGGCTTDADCPSELAPVCSPSDGRTTKICQAVGPGMLCDTTKGNADCEHGSFQGKCVDRAIFANVFMPTLAAHMTSVVNLGFGVTDILGICTEGKDGNSCDVNADCLSGYCHDFEGMGELCIGPHEEIGLPCMPNQSAGQCGSGMTCDANSHTCVGTASN